MRQLEQCATRKVDLPKSRVCWVLVVVTYGGQPRPGLVGGPGPRLCRVARPPQGNGGARQACIGASSDRVCFVHYAAWQRLARNRPAGRCQQPFRIPAGREVIESLSSQVLPVRDWAENQGRGSAPGIGSPAPIGGNGRSWRSGTPTYWNVPCASQNRSTSESFGTATAAGPQQRGDELRDPLG
jgi:hypothetical protein